MSGTATQAKPALPLGLALALAGTGLLVAVSLSGGAVRWDVFAGRLAAEMLLPAVGLGFAAALGEDPPWPLGLALGAGVVAGTLGRPLFLQTTALLPNAATHAFMTGPIAGLAVGASLFLSSGRGAWVARLLAATVAGAMATVAIRLLDPSFHDPAVPAAGWAGLLAAALAALALARALPAPARRLGARILGAWVLAVALLYGGATLAFRGRAVPPDAAGRMGPAERTLFPDFTPQPGSVP